MTKLYMYKYEDGSLFGVDQTSDIDFGFYEPASIQDLLQNIKDQLEQLKQGTHHHGSLMAWGDKEETLALKEGNFIWSGREDKGYYVEVK